MGRVVLEAAHLTPRGSQIDQKETIVVTDSSVRSSAEAAAGTSIRQRPQCFLELTLIRIAKPNGCFCELISAGLGQ